MQGQEAGKRARPSVLPAKPPRTSDYLPLRIMPSGMGPLLMASFVFYMLPQVVAFVHPPAAIAMASFLCVLANLSLFYAKLLCLFFFQ